MALSERVEVSWRLFEGSKVTASALELSKTACLIEYNSADYASYLKNVFGGDSELQRFVNTWAQEQIANALLLKEWILLADPRFDFLKSLGRFVQSYRVPLEVRESVRGSVARELVSRCVIASLASALFRSLAEHTDERVLRQICEQIATSEEKHFRTFHFFLRRHIDREKLSVMARIRVVLQRCAEMEDDEIAAAYSAAHWRATGGSTQSALRIAYRIYKYRHLQRAVSLMLTAAGLRPNAVTSNLSSAIVYGLIQTKSRLPGY